MERRTKKVIGTPREGLPHRQAFRVMRIFFDDSSRAIASRAISSGACSGKGATELTLISQST
jgi:hypothetical protein